MVVVAVLCVLVLMCLPFVVVSGSFLFGTHGPGTYGPDPIPFESARWQASPATGEHTSVRQRMVDNLLRSGVLLGKTRVEIESLLGPDDRASFNPSETMMEYLVGPERGWFSIDGEVLRITLDESHIAIKARLGTN